MSANRPQRAVETAAPTPKSGSISARAAARSAAPYLAGSTPSSARRSRRSTGRCWCWPVRAPARPRVLTTRIAHILLASAPGVPIADAGRHLHQQGGARDEGAGRAMLIGGAVEGMPWLGTFHSLAARMLRRHAELVGLKSNFTILDTDDQMRLLKQVIEARDIDKKRWPARQLTAVIERWKNRGLDARTRAGRPRHSTSRRPRRGTLRRLPGPAEGAERLRLRRPAAARADAAAQHNPTSWPTTSAASATSWSTSTRTPTWCSTCWLRLLAQGAPQHLLRRRRRPVDLRLARRRGRQHPALREGFSRREGHPAGAELPLDRPHPRRRLRR